MKPLLLLASLTLLLSACGNEQQAPSEPQGTVIDAQIEALNKAKAVEQQMQDAAEAQRKAIEQAE